MADSGGNSETDIAVLKEALCTQQHLLQKLNVELDVEREAAATAASEALSMILRLQGEKAAVKMEAIQYKRLAEEKISHAEETIALFEELIYTKEMEISSLEYQVEAYRYMLLSMGCSDLGMGVNGNVRRLKSLPVLSKDVKFKSFESERSAVPEMDLALIHGIVDDKLEHLVNVQSLEVKRSSGNLAGSDFNYYWEQIRNLDEWANEITDGKGFVGKDKYINPKVESRSFSLISQKSISSSLDPARSPLILDEMKCLDDSKEREVLFASSSCSSSVQDIFEVPEINDHRKTLANSRKGRSKLILEENKNGLGKIDLIAEETFESTTKDEIEWEKKMLPSPSPEERTSKPTAGMNFDCKLSLGQPNIGIAQCKDEIQQLSKRLELLEGERNNTRQEIRVAGEEEEEINLLKQIQQQLNSIQSEISCITKKPPPPDDGPLLSVMEGMLYFWF
ncbi:hypothetical protein SLEP1_g28530 [Rubroshorea leprosula]|uniref:GTD-binding domain-containing protein n=1 Tax=Rubroshorea leprosula TaxID=152421 RepID=A0AAV5K3Q1_9ROSI|nr:hypothetical protein SLEP1_g28530 [Rubroshorea leprosula]